MAVTMGNAIRELKLEIGGTSIDLHEQDVRFAFIFHSHMNLTGVLQAKNALCDKVDDYIRDRIILADQVIEDTAVKKIHDGDVVLTYAR